MDTLNASGILLNYWVAKAECAPCHPGVIKAYVEDWQAAGPIIEREKIAIAPTADGWEASIDASSRVVAHGDTLLVAAMRAYALKKFGQQLPSVAESEMTPV